MPRSHLLLSLTLLLAAGTAFATPRVPQVPVSGNALQNLLNAQGQSINVRTQQQDVQFFQSVFLDKPPISFGIERAAGTAGVSLYDLPAPATLFQVFPGSASPGWFVAASFRSAPLRLVVNLFDATASLVGTTTYLGINSLLQGIAVVSATTVFSEDAQNPGGQPRVLFFQGTGTHSNDVWLAADNDGNGDFADAVFLLTAFAPVPVQGTSWGRVKALFR